MLHAACLNVVVVGEATLHVLWGLDAVQQSCKPAGIGSWNVTVRQTCHTIGLQRASSLWLTHRMNLHIVANLSHMKHRTQKAVVAAADGR